MDTTLSNAPEHGWLRAAVGPLVSRRGWSTLLHNLLGLPLGQVYLIWLITGFALGAGLAITLVGIPILTLVLASVWPLVSAERRLATALLGAELGPVPSAPAGDGWLGRFKAYWTDGRTWRGTGYLLARGPVGIVTFTVAVSLYASAGWLLAAPLVAPLTTMEFGIWTPDSVPDGLALVPLGALLLVASAWLSEGMGAGSRALARWGTR